MDVSALVEVSCAAIIRKLMCSTISRSVKRSPSSEVACARRLKRSTPSPARLPGRSAALDPAAHRGPGERPADDPEGRRDHVGEGPAHRLGLGAELDPHEGEGGDVEGEALVLGVDRRLEARAALGPRGEAEVDRRGHRPEVAGERPLAEGDLHDPPGRAVLVAVHRHDRPGEDAADVGVPAGAAGEVAVAVAQDVIEGVGAEEREHGGPERVAVEGGPEPPVEAVEAADHVALDREEVAEEGEAAGVGRLAQVPARVAVVGCRLHPGHRAPPRRVTSRGVAATGAVYRARRRAAPPVDAGARGPATACLDPLSRRRSARGSRR
jgi:hypothetical protein